MEKKYTQLTLNKLARGRQPSNKAAAQCFLLCPIPHPQHAGPKMSALDHLHVHTVIGKHEGYVALGLSVPLMRKAKGFPNLPPHFIQQTYLLLIDQSWVIWLLVMLPLFTYCSLSFLQGFFILYTRKFMSQIQPAVSFYSFIRIQTCSFIYIVAKTAFTFIGTETV